MPLRQAPQQTVVPPVPLYRRLTAAAFAALTVALATLATPAPARADDGCTVLLCLAGNWREVTPCRATVHRVLRDVARGRHFPRCEFGSNPTQPAGATTATPVGGANYTRHDWASGTYCPPQYRTPVHHPVTGELVDHRCQFTGAVLTVVNGQPWNRTWWREDGESVTEWLPAGRAGAAQARTPIDDRYDRDLRAWQVAEAERQAREAQRRADDAIQSPGGG